ncbi:hypothetical protein [Clostridium manihotivorum]|uniref:Uncharacterized protein n=1 Tax=Clostridium manihotivorum TaxID=2320868 RepID=A0A410DWJ2_9CLOT|nr:hypothetical protein [Clostridium manihotivorum]QAA33526.1 hypothetical protein C1I91_18775 [Clostridium manihotivorum]
MKLKLSEIGSLSAAPAGIGAVAKVKNAIKLGEIGGKVEGSISFGMNGGGQLEDILNKVKKSKAEEDMVAKEAVTIDKGGSKADIIIDGLKVIDGKVGGKIPINEYNELRDLSIHNKSSDSITLGKYRPTINSDGTENWKIPGPDSYNTIAKNDGHMYFDMGSAYDDAMNKYELNYQEMLIILMFLS